MISFRGRRLESFCLLQVVLQFHFLPSHHAAFSTMTAKDVFNFEDFFTSVTLVSWRIVLGLNMSFNVAMALEFYVWTLFATIACRFGFVVKIFNLIKTVSVSIIIIGSFSMT